MCQQRTRGVTPHTFCGGICQRRSTHQPHPVWMYPISSTPYRRDTSVMRMCAADNSDQPCRSLTCHFWYRGGLPSHSVSGDRLQLLGPSAFGHAALRVACAAYKPMQIDTRTQVQRQEQLAPRCKQSRVMHRQTLQWPCSFDGLPFCGSRCVSTGVHTAQACRVHGMHTASR